MSRSVGGGGYRVGMCGRYANSKSSPSMAALFDAADLIAFDDIGVLTILLTAFYLGAIAVGNYRYR